MRDKLLVYALAASIGVHLILLGLVGETSAAKPIPVEQLKVVRVDLVKTPDDAVMPRDKPDAPKPNLETPYVPPVTKMVTDTHPPKPKPRPTPGRHPVNPGHTTATTLPGDPGGPLGGLLTPRGVDMGHVPSGNTLPGWVPGDDTGTGIGPGTGPGRGTPEPDPNAHPGPGLEPGPGPVSPPSPPQPKMLSVTVCAVSGMIPGPYCQKKETRSFREGSEPRSTCNQCKAPEPPHVNRVADRSEPELVRDSQPKLPPMDEPGEYTVRIRYTVNADGSVGDIELTDSSGVPAIDRAIREAAAKMHYKPAVQNGEPRSVKIRRTYRVRV